MNDGLDRCQRRPSFSRAPGAIGVLHRSCGGLVKSSRGLPRAPPCEAVRRPNDQMPRKNADSRKKPKPRRLHVALEPEPLVIWTDVAEDERDRHGAMRCALSILTATPLPGALGPLVRRPGASLLELVGSGSRRPRIGEPDNPISYVQLAEHFRWNGFSASELFSQHAPQRAPLPMTDLLRRRSQIRRALSPTRARKKRGQRRQTVSAQLRPGGREADGRRPRHSTSRRRPRSSMTALASRSCCAIRGRRS